MTIFMYMLKAYWFGSNRLLHDERHLSEPELF